MHQFDWLCDMYRCVMSPTPGIYWVELGLINNYKKPQLWLVLLRYSANVASVFPWVITTTIFVPPANNIEIVNNVVKNVLASKNIKKGKSILGASPKLDKKKIKNLRAKKANSQKFKQKKQHLCHHCGVAGHTWPNCYKWLATQQSNVLIVSGNQNQFPSSFSPLGDLLKALMFLSNLNGFNFSPLPPVQGFTQRKGSSKLWKENGFKWFYHISFFLLVFVFALHVCFPFMFWVSLVLCFTLFNMFLFFFSFVYFFFHIKIKKNWKIKKIQKQCVFCVHWYLCILDGYWNNFF